MPTETLTLVIATGQGEGLMPLTLHRAKAAVPFGGKFRLIDFTLANCLHSGLRRVLVFTQSKSFSLHKHLRDGWSIFHPELGEFITPVPPQMRDSGDWYRGTLDAMRRNRYLIERSGARRVLILEGDLVYRMDYAEMIRFHGECGAEITLAGRMSNRGSLSGVRLMTLGADGQIEPALEVPEGGTATRGGSVCAPMGVYLLEKQLLLSLLDSEEEVGAADAGPLGDALISLAGRFRVRGYGFGGERGRVTPDRYWSDLANLDAYYEANMALLETEPPLDLYQEDWNIHTYQGQYPPARTVPGLSGTEGVFINSMLASGSVISGGGVNHSILFPRVRVADDAIVEDAILFHGVKVGPGAHLRRCIIDMDVQVPAKERIGMDLEADRQRFSVSTSGVVVIPKGFRF